MIQHAEPADTLGHGAEEGHAAASGAVDVVHHLADAYEIDLQPLTTIHLPRLELFGLDVSITKYTVYMWVAALLMLALPGSVYLYQGEELGLPEVEDLPDERLTDPTWERSGRTVRGRDGCRVPLPWSGDAPPFGFSDDPDTEPWLPQPPEWRDRTVAALEADPDSILHLYRTALRLRHELDALGDGGMRWLEGPPDALVIARDPGFVCMLNLEADPLAIPPNAEVLLHSDPEAVEQVPPDGAVWLKIG